MKLCLPRNNPFPVDAWFDSSCTLTYALPKDDVLQRLPPCLEPETYQDRWAFLAVAVVQTRGLRPAGLPGWLGRDFLLVGYRFFVRLTTPEGRRLRGLYILRSETDSASVARWGNLFTQYRYVRTDVKLQRAGERLSIAAPAGGLRIEVDASQAELPPGSPFADLAEARKFSGPLPLTFSWEPVKRRVAVVEGRRSHWEPRPVRVEAAEIPFLAELGLGHARLANAFLVTDIPYRWTRGRVQAWRPR